MSTKWPGAIVYIELNTQGRVCWFQVSNHQRRGKSLCLARVGADNGGADFGSVHVAIAHVTGRCGHCSTVQRVRDSAVQSGAAAARGWHPSIFECCRRQRVQDFGSNCQENRQQVSSSANDGAAMLPGDASSDGEHGDCS